jgi:hypothetical protein
VIEGRGGSVGKMFMLQEEMRRELSTFIKSWEETPRRTKKAFLRLKEYLTLKADIAFSFKSRPGVSYSLRAAHAQQRGKPLFAMVDVIDDDPVNRWLSVCFYADMIADPAEKGDLVPGGLLGEDGYCFGLEKWDENELLYLEERLNEAYRSASGRET